MDGGAAADMAANGLEDEEDNLAEEANLDEADEDDVEGWDLGDDVNVEGESDFVTVESGDGAVGGPGSSEAEQWARNSPLAADHVAAGSFESAMTLLNRQVGAVNFAPLKDRFLEIYSATKTYLPATAGLPPLVNYVRRTVDETDPRKVLPIIPRDLETVASIDLQAGYTAMKGNKLEEALVIFKKILHTLLVSVVNTKSEVEEAQKVVSTVSEYIVAVAVELERRTLPQNDSNVKRNLELSAYFTIPKLEVAHRQLALMSAMNIAFRAKNLSSALSFASRYLANGVGPSSMLDKAKKMKQQCERNPTDAVEIDYDAFAEFEVCARSHTPIYSNERHIECPFDGSKYLEKFKGTACAVCEVCEVGASSAGWRLVV